MSGKPIAIPVRFWPKVEKTETCWLWIGHVDAQGYGRFNVNGRGEPAHRVAFTLKYGEIPDGLSLDHLCRVRRCVNPKHLEAVPLGVNVLRGEGPSAEHARATHCPQGHPYNETNTYRDGQGKRACRICHRDRERGRYAAGLKA